MSTEFEQSVLGAVLQRPELIDVVDLDAEHFDREQHGQIWQAITALNAKDGAGGVDVLTVHDHMRRFSPNDHTIAPYLAELIDLAPTVAHVEYHAYMVREAAARRKLHSLTIQLAKETRDGPIQPVIEQIEAGLRDIRRTAGAAAREQSRTTLLAAMNAAMALFEERNKNPNTLPGLSTGLKDLDDKTDGLIGGEVTVIAGRPAMGKTALALQIAEHVAAQEKHVLIASLEMSPVEIASRLLSGKSGISQKALRRGMLQSDDWKKLTEVGNIMSYGGNGLQISAARTVDAMRAQCDSDGFKADLLVVDYLQLLGNVKAENRQLAVAEISRGLKLLAMERNMPVVAVSQLNREADNRKNHRPELSDLRESGAIEQDADVVLLLFRADYYDEDSPEKGTAKVIIAKNRNGETGTVKLAWRGEIGRFDLMHQEGRSGINPPNPPG